MEKYVTTPIFYASGNPHLGHVYSVFIADALKRYWQLKVGRAFLITGTDEYGQKIERTAKDSGISVKQFVNQKSHCFAELWKKLKVSPDYFVRTTDDNHKHNVIDVWSLLTRSGDISLGDYTGLYCVECEQFYSEHQLVDGCCSIHETPVIQYSKPSYLFNLSKHLQSVLSYIEANEDFIQPENYRREVIRFLKESDQENLSISRTDFQWGISVPGNNEHVVYVWVDALFSYLTAIQALGGAKQNLANTIQVIGKDILLFHGVYWLALLSALKFPFPEKIIVHGWWTLRGKKISKSNPSSLIQPIDLAGITTIDGLKYSLLVKKPLGRDGDLTTKTLVETINSGLANSLGNLVKRCTTLISKNHQGLLKTPDKLTTYSEQSIALIAETDSLLSRLEKAYQEAQLHEVCFLVDALISSANTYFHERAPWNPKDSNPLDHAVETLQIICSLLHTISIVYSPIIPNICFDIRRQLGIEERELVWPGRVEILEFVINKPESVFQRIVYEGTK